MRVTIADVAGAAGVSKTAVSFAFNNPDDEALTTLARIGIPTVLIDSEGSAEHPAVNVDDAGGAEAAARHLLELGHRQLAVIMLPPTRAQAGPTPTSARRLAGYEAAL